MYILRAYVGQGVTRVREKYRFYMATDYSSLDCDSTSPRTVPMNSMKRDEYIIVVLIQSNFVLRTSIYRSYKRANFQYATPESENTTVVAKLFPNKSRRDEPPGTISLFAIIFPLSVLLLFFCQWFSGKTRSQLDSCCWSVITTSRSVLTHLTPDWNTWVYPSFAKHVVSFCLNKTTPRSYPTLDIALYPGCIRNTPKSNPFPLERVRV